MKNFTPIYESFSNHSRSILEAFSSHCRDLTSFLTLLLVFLTAFGGNVWAGTNGNNIAFNDCYFYFNPYYDATHTINQGYIQLAVRKYQFSGENDYGWYTGVTTLDHIEHTRLYYASTLEGTAWEDTDKRFHGWAMISNSAKKSNGDTEYWTSGNSTWYSDFKNYGLNSANTYLFIASSASNGQTIEHSGDEYISTGFAGLNHSQTVKKSTCLDGTTFSSSTFKASGTVTISAYKMTDNGTASNTDNSVTISTGSNTANVDAAYTGEVTVSASASTGYVFLGWYDAENDGTQLSNAASYTYNAPNSTYTIYARFAPKYTAGKTIYLKTMSTWENDNARFAAVFGNATQQTWVDCSTVVDDAIYSVDVPSGDWGYLIFCRMKNGNADERVNKWDNRWNQTGDLMAYGTYNCVNITGSDAGEWRKYAPSLSIVGDMNNWDPVANPMSTNTVTISLNNNKAYYFKVAEGFDTSWWGKDDTNDGTVSFVGQTDASDALVANEHNMLILTAGTGSSTSGTESYTFTWDATNHKLTVTFPDITAPSNKYVYYKNHYGWTDVYGHANGTHSTIWTGAKLSYITFGGTNYYYAALGDNANIVFNQGNSTNESSLTDIVSNKGKYYDPNDSEWHDFTISVSLNNQDATTAGAASVTATYGSAMPSISENKPDKDDYTFGGYYDEVAGGGTKYIHGTGKSAHAWDKTIASPELYALWTQVVTLEKNEGNSKGKVTVTYNGSGVSSYTAAVKTGYNVTGYFTETSEGYKVINSDGTLADYSSNISSYINSSGKWVHDGATSLYAQWTPKTCSVTFDKNEGSTGSDNATATYASALPDITPPTRSGYTFDGYWDNEEGDDGTGTQYYNADGTSAKAWDKDTEEETTLYAKWLVNHTVAWYVNGEVWTAGTPPTYAPDGKKVADLPTPPTRVDCDDLKRFVGWTTEEGYSDDDEAPEDLFTDVAGSPTITANTTFYAVFANQVGPNINTVLWSEDWTGESANAKPEHPTTSGSTVYGVAKASIDYSYSDGEGDYSTGETKVYTSNLAAGGVSPELLVHGNTTTPGYFEVSGLRKEGATTLTLTFKRNNSTDLALRPSVTGTGYSISKDSQTGSGPYVYTYTITCGTDDTFTLRFTGNTGKSNVRLDDIVLKVKSNGGTGFVTTCAECTAAPELVTPVVTSETCEGATVTASVSSFGTGDGCHIREYGFVWGTTSTPTVASNTGKYTVSGNIDEYVTFACDIDELTSASHYYVRAYAQNKYGIGYSTAQDIFTAGYKDISIEKGPDKTWFWAGTTFDPTGLEVHGILADNSEEDITASCTFDPDEETALSTEDTYVRISYTDGCGNEFYEDQTIAVYAPEVTEGTNPGWGNVSCSGTGLIAVNITTANKTCNLTVTSENASIVSNGDGTYSIVNPKGPSGTISVTVDYRNAVQKTVTYKVNGVTHSTENVYESANATFPTNVTAPSPAYGHLVGWVTESFYAQTDVPDFVYNHPVITDDITYYAVFSNCQRLRVDATTITKTSFDNYTFYNDTLTCSDLRKGNVSELGFLRFRKETKADSPGKLYNSKSLNNIIRVEVGMSGLIDTVAVYVGSAAGTISGSKLRDSSPAPYKYGYEFPASTSYFVVQGDNKNIYDVDFIDVFYNLSGTTERYVCQTRDTKASGSWNTTATWANSTKPGVDDVVRLKHDVSIYENDKHVADIVIDTCGANSGHLDIFWGGGLIVDEGIHVWNGSSFGPTTRRDLEILTNSSFNGGLICGAASNNTVAEYGSYMRSYKAGTFYINQYIGIPFTEMEAYQYYGFNIFQYDLTRDDWKTPDGSTLQAWTAYNFIRKYSGDNWAHFYVEGTLNLPGLTSPASQHTFECGSRYASAEKDPSADGYNASHPYFDNGGDYLFANSWTAPIDISSIDDSDMNEDDFVQTIYIFNAGYESGSGSRVVGDLAGQWSAFPINSSTYMGGAVIPAAQAFLVTSLTEDASFTLDYKKHVYDPAVAAGQINTSPTRAPRRAKMESNDPQILKITVNSNDTTIADQLYIFQRKDFKTDSLDNGWDGYKILGENYAAEIYTVRGNANMAVDAVKDMDSTSVAFKASSQDSEYTLSFEYNSEEPLYLYDKDTQEFTEITNENTYSFTTSDRKAHNRFLLTRSNSPQIETGVEEIDTGQVKRAEKFMQDQQIFIRRGGKVYSITGALVK